MSSDTRSTVFWFLTLPAMPTPLSWMVDALFVSCENTATPCRAVPSGIKSVTPPGEERHMATTAEPTAEARTLVHYEVKEGIAYLTLDDPPANTYTHEMMRQLDTAILQARFDKDVYVLVLQGRGEKFFCAGANINMLKGSDPYFKYNFCLHANETLNRLEQTPKLVLAALEGHTVGGGLEIAMAADILIAKKDSGKVGLPEINLGVLPGTGGTQRLARRVGKTRAIDLMITGRLITFEEAKELGIVNYIHDGADFAGHVHEFAR